MIRITGSASPRWVIDTAGTPGEPAGNAGKTRYNGGHAAEVTGDSEGRASIAPAASGAAEGFAPPIAPSSQCPDAHSTNGKCADVDAFAGDLTRAEHIAFALAAASVVQTSFGDLERLSRALRTSEESNAHLAHDSCGVPRE